MLHKPHHKKPEISLVPLINVVFLLLIFFLVVGTFARPDTQAVALPEAQTGKRMVDSALVFILHSDGPLLLNNNALPDNKIDPLLRQAFKENPAREVVIKADASLPSDTLMALISRIQTSGGSNLSISSRPPE